jgi:L,D-transpeptidase catalytic domain/Putative peptidoglycan binding domain
VLVATPSGTHRRRRWPWALAAAGAIVAAALGAAHFAWPDGTLRIGAAGLPELKLPPSVAGSLERVSLRGPDGTPIPVHVQSDGTLLPVRPVTPGTRLVAEAEFRRPGWIGWLNGDTQVARVQLTAPRAQVESRWLRVVPGAPVRVRFDRPVSKVVVSGVGAQRTVDLPSPRRAVALGRLGSAGSVGVSAVAASWERLPPPESVTWFPPGRSPMLLASPRPGAQLEPGEALRLRFSEPVASLLHGKTPTLRPQIAGRWHTVDAHTLAFTPSGYGFGLDAHVRITLPAPVVRIGGAHKAGRTVAWTAPTASELRLEELLAILGYLPLNWTADDTDAQRTWPSQLAAAADPPRGRFDWRYPNTPPELVRLWHPGVYSWIVRGAVMAFQSEHGLTVDGFAGHDVWQALIADVIAGKARTGGYSYVYVHSTVPQSLNLWHDGQLILSSPGNTGVPAAPTQLGTFAVFEHIPVGTMSGTNPDGSHYNDPGIRYISYFNHGDAIHAFNRGSFGTPQSLGCVELPLAAAAKVWPYTPIGTLVTVEQ